MTLEELNTWLTQNDFIYDSKRRLWDYRTDKGGLLISDLMIATDGPDEVRFKIRQFFVSAGIQEV